MPSESGNASSSGICCVGFCVCAGSATPCRFGFSQTVWVLSTCPASAACKAVWAASQSSCSSTVVSVSAPSSSGMLSLCVCCHCNKYSRNAFSCAFAWFLSTARAGFTATGVGSTRASDCGASLWRRSRNCSRPRSQSKSSCCGSTGAPAGSSKVKANSDDERLRSIFWCSGAGSGCLKPYGSV